MFDGIKLETKAVGFSTVLRLNSNTKRREIAANELRTSVLELTRNGHFAYRHTALNIIDLVCCDQDIRGRLCIMTEDFGPGLDNFATLCTVRVKQRAHKI
jgi:hypothetical protein